VTESFDKDYWDAHWDAGLEAERPIAPAHPALDRESRALAPGTAFDAGCGEGAEAIWLASHGWAVTAADISPRALDVARERADAAGVDVDWVEADLSDWSPESTYDLVTTFYAHPTIPQLEFYARIADWVNPGGTLLIVGHLQGHDEGAHGHGAPAEASVTAEAVAAALTTAGWSVQTAAESERTLHDRSGHPVQLADVVVRAVKGSPVR
jgi:2-polyprenyl-3-methyl-5-hydroxy-6-metoxy-1,4-benzoquinol methylase